MNVSKIANLNIRPTDKKMRKAKELVDNILPKELPLEKFFRYASEVDRFERIKDSIQISIDKMTRG